MSHAARCARPRRQRRAASHVHARRRTRPPDRLGPPSSSSCSPPPPVRSPVRVLSLAAAPLPLDARRPLVPESLTRLIPPLACPTTNLLCPSLPASPTTALGPTHIWVGRGRGSPVRSSGDPLPRCQVPPAIWRGARDTAPDTHPRLSREVGGNVGDESRDRDSEPASTRTRPEAAGGAQQRPATPARRALPPARARHQDRQTARRLRTALDLPARSIAPQPRRASHDRRRPAAGLLRLGAVTAEAAQTRCTVSHCHTRRAGGRQPA